MSTAQSGEPVSFRAAIELGGKTARRHFDAMAYSHRLRWVLSVEDAKTDETRRRRIAKAVATLREGRRP